MVNQLQPGLLAGTLLGQGLRKGIEQGAQVQYQKGLLQDALEQAKKEIFAPPKQLLDAQGKPQLDKQGKPLYEPPSQNDYLNKVFAIMKATAGIPGSERYLGQLFDILSRQQQGQAISNIGTPGAPQTKPMPGFEPQTGGQPEISGQPVLEVPEAIQEGLPGEQPGTTKEIPYTPEQKQFISNPINAKFYSRGLLPKTLTFDDEQAYIRNVQEHLKNFMTPEQLNTFAREEIQKEKDSRDQRIKDWQTLAKERGITTDEMPAFMRISENYSESPSLTEGVDRALLEYIPRVRSAFDALDKIKMPGFFGRKIGGKPLVGGVIGSLLTGGRTRDESVEALKTPVRNLVELGKENEARAKLIAMGLSPTEIETTIKDLRGSLEESIKNLPSASKLNKVDQVEELTNFFVKNLTNEDSLLDIRDRLVESRGYDWKNFAKALENAIKIRKKKNNPIIFSPRQSQELIDFTQMAPKQGLDSVFQTGIEDLAKGAK